jgi:hypothetical protein
LVPGRRILLVQNAVGATQIEQWQPGNELYQQAIDRTTIAVNSGKNNSIKVILWHQGETDIFVGTQEYTYREKLTNTIRSFRSSNISTITQETPWIVGEFTPGLNNWYKNLEDGYLPYMMNVIDALPTLINNTCTVNTTGLNGFIHFDGASYRELGKRYYECYMSLVPLPTVVPTTLVPTTAVPTTPVPTTLVPTTPVPTTLVPTTPVPTTLVPTTPVPTTLVPTTPVPTTLVPTTLVPTTAVPTTLVPTTLVPTTAVPTTLVPTTAVPTTPVPTTPVPTTPVPTTTVPTTLVPTTTVPTTTVPTTLVPTTDLHAAVVSDAASNKSFVLLKSLILILITIKIIRAN